MNKYISILFGILSQFITECKIALWPSICWQLAGRGPNQTKGRAGLRVSGFFPWIDQSPCGRWELVRVRRTLDDDQEGGIDWWSRPADRAETRRSSGGDGAPALREVLFSFSYPFLPFSSLFFGVRLLLFSLHLSPYRKIYPFYSFIWIHGEKLGS